MYDVLAILALLIVGFMFFLILFEPGLRYAAAPPAVPIDCDQYLQLIGALADAEIHHDSSVEVLTNGEAFYEAQLAAIRAAKSNIHLEAYIFFKGEVADRFLEALTERARAGVRVKVVLDYIGSFTTPDKLFADLRAAGGRVCWYQPIRWYTFKRLNNRTHRELLVVDGEVGFIGGAGIADFWLKDEPKHPRWRDTVCRIRGRLVVGLQTTFSENWLESAEEILTNVEDYAPFRPGYTAPECGEGDVHKVSGMVVISSPSAGRGTRSRMLFQTLLASACDSIHINSPYFLPDRSTRAELIRAVKERGVKVKIIVPGHRADHALTRASGRRLYGDLLQNGIEIYEYEPSMIHVKALVVDGVWAVVGSTNFDNRSFGINDEVNLAARDRGLCARLTRDFDADVSRSKPISYEEWKRRPMTEKLFEIAGMIIQRQQ